jgi:hypothetical protein
VSGRHTGVIADAPASTTSTRWAARCTSGPPPGRATSPSARRGRAADDERRADSPVRPRPPCGTSRTSRSRGCCSRTSPRCSPTATRCGRWLITSRSGMPVASTPSSGSRRAASSSAPRRHTRWVWGSCPCARRGSCPGETYRADLHAGVRHGDPGDPRRRVRHGQRVLIMDDVLATGGTAAATCELVERAGGQVVAVDCRPRARRIPARARRPAGARGRLDPRRLTPTRGGGGRGRHG